MTAVKATEVRPGLVVHLDTAVLRKLGGAETNAEVNGTHDRAVQGPHYFLVLEVGADRCTAAPLFSIQAPGSDQLAESGKSGLADKWIGDPTYTSRWQQWRIPLASIEAASADEESSSSDRRGYSGTEFTEVATLLSWQTRNRAGYRAV